MDVCSWMRACITSRLYIGLLFLGLFTTLFPDTSHAVPSFARQTGEPCSVCHTQAFGPNLTPFGREFKLTGYTLGSSSALPPLAAMARFSFTRTDEGQPGGPGDDFNSNNNSTLDEAALFYAGRIYKKLGGFSELTYEGGTADTLALDNTDIRYADQGTIAGGNAVYGVTLNNNPTAQDLWNTTPVWGFPYADSPLAPTPSAETLIEGLGGQVAGATAYLMWNDKLYGELGAYASLRRGTQSALNTFDSEENQIDGAAPYWRLAYQQQWNNQYFSVGHFGMYAKVFPERDSSAGNDSLTDLGVDATYQYLGNNSNIFEAKASFTHERQSLDASQALGLADNSSDILNKFKLDGTYTYQQTYGMTLGVFKTTGSTDFTRYGDSANGSPDSQGYMVELDYIPFGKQDSYASPWANLRLGLNYTGYTKFDGASNDYDGAGRDASDNNTLLLNAWLVF